MEPVAETFFIGQRVRPNGYASEYYRALDSGASDSVGDPNSDRARREMRDGIVTDIFTQHQRLIIKVTSPTGLHYFKPTTLTSDEYVIDELPYTPEK